MATVTGLTAQRMIEIEDASVVNGQVVGSDLILTTHGGDQINAGSVAGPPGPAGPAVASLDDVADVNVTGAVDGDVLTWDGSAWQAEPMAIPTGIVWPYVSSAAPNGWLKCDGSPIPLGTEYDALRALCGANVPDMRDRFIVGQSATKPVLSKAGEELVVLTSSQIPAHYHGKGSLAASSAGAHQHGSGSGTNGLIVAELFGGISLSSANPTADILGSQEHTTVDGAHGHSITGNTANNTPAGGSHNNMPPYISLYYIIKI